MRFYTIHAPRRLGNITGAGIEAAIAETRAVKEGFSWPAFVFSWVWALWHRLWLVAAAIFAAEFVAGLICGFVGIGAVMSWVIWLGMGLVVGWLANDLRRDHLERRGLADLGVVIAGSGEDAIERYFTETSPRESYAMPGSSSFNGRRPL
jgi:hypothetical protein